MGRAFSGQETCNIAAWPMSGRKAMPGKAPCNMQSVCEGANNSIAGFVQQNADA